MAIPDPVLRFRFDFADLKRAPAPDLRVLMPQLEPLPSGAVAAARHPRPRWLPPLLPVIRTSEPLRVRLVDATAPVWASRLRSSLSGLFAAAGARAELRVSEWQDGFAVGAPGFDQLPTNPHSVIVAAECDPASMDAAVRLMSSLDPGQGFLALHGNELALDRAIGLDLRLLARGSLFRFPVVGRRELSALAGDRPPGLRRCSFGRACFALAQAVAARYRETGS